MEPTPPCLGPGVGLPSAPGPLGYVLRSLSARQAKQRRKFKLRHHLAGIVRTLGIVCPVLPLASASGPAIIGVVVVASGLFLSWLLRSETGDDPPEAAPASTDTTTPQRTVTSQPSE